ncbi:MAG: hypothetical protein ACE5L6_02110 [Candidatus Bathyarchaeia archaeon]
MQEWDNKKIEAIAKQARMNPKYLKVLIRYLRDNLLIIIKV